MKKTMRRNTVRTLRTMVCTPVFLILACAPDAPSSDVAVLFQHEGIWSRMLEAEDSRGAGPTGIAPLIEGLRHGEPVIRRIAVRGVGRLERDSLADFIVPLLSDASPEVRAEAANALAQAVGRGHAAQARAALRDRIATEPLPAVLGTLAEALGRLAHEDSVGVAGTVTTLAGLVDRAAPDSSADSLRLGVVRAFYFLARQPAGRSAIVAPGPGTLRRLATVTPPAGSSPSVTGARIRTVATAALVATGTATVSDLAAILDDRDPYVRREAVAGLATLGAGDSVAALVRGALDDPSAVVRYEALRVDARTGAGRPCVAVLQAVADPDTHVALQAIDRLATGCGGDAAVPLLDSLAATLPTAGSSRRAAWHRPAQATVVLAGLDPARARAHISRLEESANSFVRMRAARAATLSRVPATLYRLAADSVANVRTEAVRGLARVEGHVADSVYIAQLREADDSQLLQAAAAALAGSLDADAVDALLGALDRLTARTRDTERDARVALLDRISELGDSTHAARLARRIDDYDPRIVELASDIVERWTGERPVPTPRPFRAPPLPTLEELAALDRARVTIDMEDGSRIILRLFPLEAPTNAYRFARLARDGYYDGLTFHRVVPNFVIQGGSPNANEYSGDGPFSRDELGRLANWRGSVGLSTRGRDTGDAQIFINLIDNVRLDHEYTVFGEVVSDLESVRGILEGDRIRRIRID